MREAHLAGPRRRPAADERERRRGVVRRTERPRAEQRVPWVHETGHAVHRARGKRLVVVKRRKERGQRPSEHGLPRPRRADEQQAVRARGRDLEGALRRLLSGDVGEVDGGALRGGAGAGATVGATRALPATWSTASRSEPNP